MQLINTPARVKVSLAWIIENSIIIFIPVYSFRWNFIQVKRTFLTFYKCFCQPSTMSLTIACTFLFETFLHHNVSHVLNNLTKSWTITIKYGKFVHLRFSSVLLNFIQSSYLGLLSSFLFSTVSRETRATVIMFCFEVMWIVSIFLN